jgi:hypothetical protein
MDTRRDLQVPREDWNRESNDIFCCKVRSEMDSITVFEFTTAIDKMVEPTFRRTIPCLLLDLKINRS